MEGGGSFGFPNLRNYPPSHRPSPPPLTAIDRFLLAQKENILVPQNAVFHSNPSSNSNFYNYNPWAYGGGVMWPIVNNETNFVDGFSLDGTDQETENYDEDDDMNPNSDLNGSDSNQFVDSNGNGEGKKIRGYPPNLIKGQWTDEEDRKLVRLVNLYGVRKWAQIAEKMVGRAGKQCRERWNNHLRPDIKKDSWTHEEERMLVEAHMAVGNKWAEIAKRIPGRTENSIKNHWNATKRRQNSRRKTRKNQTIENAVTPQPSLLQDYIKFNTSKEIKSAAMLTPNNLILERNFSEPPMDDQSQSLIDNTYDDELKFMLHNFVDKPEVGMDVGPITEPKSNEQCYTNSDFNEEQTNISQFVNHVKEEIPSQNYMFSDLYASYLLDGGRCSFDSMCCRNNHGMNVETETTSSMNMMNGGVQSIGRDMDLIEMVSSSKFF